MILQGNLMARPKSVIRPTRLNTSLPADLRYQVDKYLMKKNGGSIPVGSYQAFIISLMNEFFKKG
jgi:hypothetical protein